MNNNLIPNMDAKTKEAVIRKLLVAQAITPTTDDEICFKSMRLLASATDKIARLTLDKPQKEIPLADIEIGERYSISDLPDLVATEIAQPFGSLGDGWASFAQKAEYAMRGKLSRCAMRKLGHSAERLELALGCLKWADIVGIHDIPQFQAAFTSALILDKDATTELNGETIDIKPEATKMPFDKSVWMQILDGVKSLIAGQEEIKNEMRDAKPKTKHRRAVSMENACTILKKLNCPVNRRTISRWLNGQNTPEGFTPEKMESVEAFSAWATIHANREQSRINSNNALRIDNPKNDEMKKFR